MRLILVEDEPLLRELLAENLGESGEHELVAVFRDGASALAAQVPADVAIVDIDLGEGPDGIAVAARWRAVDPTLAIVFLSNLRDPAVLLEVPHDSSVGGLAYLHKRSATSMTVLVDTIARAARGEVVIDPVLSRDIPVTSGGLEALTAHQRRILQLIASGSSNRAIADSLGVPVKSVENATAGALRSLGIDGADPSINVRVVASLTYLSLLSRVDRPV
ncbi:MAG: response regulator transcription factor [Candidatus Nanopelagicales bacterium]|nr:response regulator transcription factor [Candidatus Nanopelagicales bacterium]MCF8536986.1 response regulator transcription factor [Candidatus Nanopelagicales bacterium]MCF8543403.1 response regulator transcription factor [Candidatus Nanopelagicales bacterium]MCF8556843.1 response regulator transcription factor [Candidatus Nanopelagicales bacterium]